MLAWDFVLVVLEGIVVVFVFDSDAFGLVQLLIVVKVATAAQEYTRLVFEFISSV